MNIRIGLDSMAHAVRPATTEIWTQKTGISEKWLLPMYSLICMCTIAAAAALERSFLAQSTAGHRARLVAVPWHFILPRTEEWAETQKHAEPLPAAMHRRLFTDLIQGGEKSRKTRFLCQLFVCHNLFPQWSKREAHIEQKCDNESQFGPYFVAESYATKHFLFLGAGFEETGKPWGYMPHQWQTPN